MIDWNKVIESSQKLADKLNKGITQPGARVDPCRDSQRVELFGFRWKPQRAKRLRDLFIRLRSDELQERVDEAESSLTALEDLKDARSN